MSPVTTETRTEWSSRLAQALVQGGYDTESNLAPLVAEAKATGQSLATLLISRNLALPGVVVGALAHLANMPAIDLAAMAPSPEAIAAMPEDIAQEFGAVPLQFDGSVLAVAFAEPPSSADVEALSARIGHRVNPVLADPVVISESLHPNGAVVPGPAPESPLVDASSPESDESAMVVRQASKSCSKWEYRLQRTTGPCHCTSTTSFATRSRLVLLTSI